MRQLCVSGGLNPKNSGGSGGESSALFKTATPGHSRQVIHLQCSVHALGSEWPTVMGPNASCKSSSNSHTANACSGVQVESTVNGTVYEKGVTLGKIAMGAVEAKLQRLVALPRWFVTIKPGYVLER